MTEDKMVGWHHQLNGHAQWKRASSRGETGNLGFLSFSDSSHRVPAELGQESHQVRPFVHYHIETLSGCSFPSENILFSIILHNHPIKGKE